MPKFTTCSYIIEYSASIHKCWLLKIKHFHCSHKTVCSLDFLDTQEEARALTRQAGSNQTVPQIIFIKETWFNSVSVSNTLFYLLQRHKISTSCHKFTFAASLVTHFIIFFGYPHSRASPANINEWMLCLLHMYKLICINV